MRWTLAAGLVLVLCLAHAAVPSLGHAAKPSSDSASELRDFLCHDAWSHTTMLGRVAIESRTIAFYEDGVVRQEVRDDTGIHEMRGAWSLETKADRVFLVLEGKSLRIHGRYAITRDAEMNAITLQNDEKSAKLVFERDKGFRRAEPATTERPVRYRARY